MRMLEGLTFFKTDFYPKFELVNVSVLVSFNFSCCFPDAVAIGKSGDGITSFFQSNDGKSNLPVFLHVFIFCLMIST